MGSPVLFVYLSTLCDQSTQKVGNECLFFFNETTQGNVQIFVEFRRQANKHTNTTFKMKMSEKTK